MSNPLNLNDRPAVVILDRLPGFCAYRALQDGDAVLGIVEQPGVRMADPEDLSSAIRQQKPGTQIRLQVFRRGRLITVPIVLDPRPAKIGLAGVEELRRQREARAADYWRSTFGPVLEGKPRHN